MDESRKIRLAVVDDDPLFLDHVSAVLSHDGGMQVVKAQSGKELVTALEETPVDCVVLDYDLGAETGFGVGETLKAKLPDPPPMVMLTGAGNERTAVKAFRSGISDYVSKRRLDTNELVSAIRSAVEKRAKARAEEAERAHTGQPSQRDRTTGLFTQAYVDALLEAFTRGRQRASFALILVQIRDLAGIRANLGQIVSDRAVHAFARRLRQSPCGTGIRGHCGADAFVYLIDRKTTPGEVVDVCAKLAGELSFEVDFERVAVQLLPAIGAAIFPQDGADPEALMQAAQRALNQAVASESRYATAFRHGSTDESGAGAADAPSNQIEGSVIHQRPERRRVRRQRVLKHGKILMRDHNSVVDCTVRDVSPLGAHLRVDSYFAAPDRFDLMIVGSGGARPVEVHWQNANDIGVSFLQPAETNEQRNL